MQTHTRNSHARTQVSVGKGKGEQRKVGEWVGVAHAYMVHVAVDFVVIQAVSHDEEIRDATIRMVKMICASLMKMR